MLCSLCFFCFFSDLVVRLFFFFFFQAEDGIRDIGVTGVQTCALPICTSYEVPADMPGGTIEVDGRDSEGTTQPVVVTESLVMPRRWWALKLASGERRLRSEERRVGKEGRSRLWREPKKKTTEARQSIV